MDFHYGASFGQAGPDAYERLLLDAMLGDPTLFARRDEVEAAWALMQPILDAWADPAAPADRPLRGRHLGPGQGETRSSSATAGLAATVVAGQLATTPARARSDRHAQTDGGVRRPGAGRGALGKCTTRARSSPQLQRAVAPLQGHGAERSRLGGRADRGCAAGRRVTAAGQHPQPDRRRPLAPPPSGSRQPSPRSPISPRPGRQSWSPIPAPDTGSSRPRRRGSTLLEQEADRGRPGDPLRVRHRRGRRRERAAPRLARLAAPRRRSARFPLVGGRLGSSAASSSTT